MVFVALAVALSASAGAQEDQTMEVNLTQSRDSGVSGTATLEDVEGGVEVALEMRGLPEPGIKHINHIHAGGTCADDRVGRTAPVTIPLETITAQSDGTGSASTTIEDVSVASSSAKTTNASYSCTQRPKKVRGSLRGSPARIWTPWRTQVASDLRLCSSRERFQSRVLGAGFSSCNGASVLKTRRHALFALCKPRQGGVELPVSGIRMAAGMDHDAAPNW
jgi:hypothetical protein